MLVQKVTFSFTESSKVKQCFVKSLDDALEFARSGTKSSTQQHRGEDSEHSEQDEEHSEQDGKPSENDNDIKLSGSDKENENDWSTAVVGVMIDIHTLHGLSELSWGLAVG